MGSGSSYGSPLLELETVVSLWSFPILNDTAGLVVRTLDLHLVLLFSRSCNFILSFFAVHPNFERYSWSHSVVGLLGLAIPFRVGIMRNGSGACLFELCSLSLVL